MSRHEIPARWMDAVREHVRATRGEDRDHLLVYDFTGESVRLGFEDGSYAFFRDAFHLRDEALREVAVFTEHCGYHFFSSEALEVEVLQTVRLHAAVTEDWSGQDG
jgi:hypothetical protein